MRIHQNETLSAAAIIVLMSLACSLPFLKPTELPASETPQKAATGVPVNGSEPTPTPTLGNGELPATPEAGGLKVVYTSEDQLFIWSEGEARQLTQSGEVYNPKISPDGTMIAFMRPADEFHLEIWMIRADGGGERKLVGISDMDTIAGGVRDSSAVAVNPYPDYGWVPGTHKIAFTSQQIFQGPGLNLLNDLNLVDADSGVITNLFLSGWGGMFAFSPDGKQVVVSQPDKILLANSDGSDYRSALTYEPVTTYSEYRYYARPVWASDGSYLIAALPPVDPLAKPAQPTELWRLEIDGSSPKMTGSVTAVPFQEQEVVFSPDLSRVAYLKETGSPEENKRELHLAAIDGGGDWIYATASPIAFSGWSQNSRQFAYGIGQDFELWIGSLDLPPQPAGSAFTGAQSVDWIGDSQLLLWLLNGNVFDLYLADLEGGSTLLDTAFGGRPNFSFTR